MPVIELTVPAVGESVTEVTVAALLVEDGAYVEMDEPIAELESDKATFELPAEKSGKISFKVSEGDDINVGDVVASLDTDAEGGGSETQKEATPQASPQEEATEDSSPTQKDEVAKTTYATGHPSPAAAKLMAENQLSADDIEATGKDGRITKADVQEAINNKKAAPQQKPAAKTNSASANTSVSTSTSATSGDNRNTRREKMSRLRRTIATRLVNAKNNTAMLTTFNEVDLSAVMDIRKQYKELFKEKHDIGLGFMSFFLKASAMALQDFPAVNAYLDEDAIEYHDFVDISIAVSTPKGLVVPVIRNAEQQNMAQLEQSVKDLAIKGRNNDLSIEEMTGGTFTITNGGIFGSMLSTPILNPPQSAILGMHNILQRPVAINGQVEIRPMMYLALSYDHRIIDGKEAVSFLVRIKELLEEPMKLFLAL